MNWGNNVRLDVMPSWRVALSACSIGARLVEHVHVPDVQDWQRRSQLETLLYDSFGGVGANIPVWRKESSTCCAEEETEDEREGGQC
jgi:hypothetical protein